MSDTDSDDDSVPNSFHKHPHENNVIHTQLPKSKCGSYNNMMTSNFNMPQRFMGFEQRSMYSRRGTSPMPLRSFPNSRMPSQQLYPLSAMSSRGLVNNARCRSPMPVQRACSNATVSALNIALALKNGKFTKNDEQLICEAYKSFETSRVRKRIIAKRKNLKPVSKYCRKNSGRESGTEKSNSSLSGDDCSSTKSAFYTQDMTTTRARPPRMDLNTFTRQVRETHNYIDRTENFKQNSFRNLLTVQSKNVNHSFLPHHKQQNVTYDSRYPAAPKTREDQSTEPQNSPVVTLKDRLAKDASLPIQRFNMSNANPTHLHHGISYKVKSKTAPQKGSASNNKLEESFDESEEIFAPSTSRVNQTQSSSLPQKRALETQESVSYPESKRKKLMTSPVKQNKSASSKNMKITRNSKDLKYKENLLPVRKLGTLVRDNESEILIAKSSQPLVGNVEPLSDQLKKNPEAVITTIDKLDTNKQTKQPPQNPIGTINNTITDTTQNSTNVSMKPSQKRRKLFTQTLDILENKNISSDDLDVNSPQTKVLRACRKKNKVRKLTSQSCLSRDVSDNKNYMDLLRKFLPPDQPKNPTPNDTNVANKEEASKRNPEDSNWDDSLAVSICDNNEGSETYTRKDKKKTNNELIVKQLSRNSQYLMNATNETGAEKKSTNPIPSARNPSKLGINQSTQSNEIQKLKDKSSVSKNTKANTQQTEPVRNNNIDTCNDSNNSNRRCRSISKNTKANTQQTEPVRNNNIDTCNDSNNSNRRCRSISKNTRAKVQQTEPIINNKLDTCNDSNNSNRRCRAVSKITKAKQQTEPIRNNKIDTCTDSNNSNRRSRSVTRNTKANTQQTEPVRNNNIDTCNDSNNSNRRCRSISKNTKAKVQQTEPIINNKLDTCNDSNNSNRRCRAVSKITKAKQQTEPIRNNKIDTCTDSNNSNRRSRSVTRNTKANTQQTEPIRNNNIDTCTDSNNSNRRSRSVTRNTKANTQQTEPIRNNNIDTCTDSNNSNRRSRSVTRNTKANTQQTEPVRNNNIDTCNGSNKSNRRCRSISKNTKAELEQTEPIKNNKINTKKNVSTQTVITKKKRKK